MNTIKSYMIQVSDTGTIYVDGIPHYFDNDLDTNNEDDMNKKILIALASQMEYEAVPLFEEICDTLEGLVENQ